MSVEGVKMKITKRQLRRIIKEEKQKLIRETAGLSTGAALRDVEVVFRNEMLQFFKEDPEAFAGRSTEQEWKWQVDAATAMLGEELSETLGRVEMMLHDGQFHTG